MILASLREEQQMLEVTQNLAGELLLEVLIAAHHGGHDPAARGRTRLAVRLRRQDRRAVQPSTPTAWRHGRSAYRPHSGIAGAVFTTGKTENIADPYADPRFNQAVDRRTGFTTRNILCVPIINKAGARIGVTQALNKRGGAFTAKDEARLKAFAAQVAVSLENAKLFDDVLSMKNYNESILKSTSNGIVTARRRGPHRHRQRSAREAPARALARRR